jgi:hypothetical protein
MVEGAFLEGGLWILVCFFDGEIVVIAWWNVVNLCEFVVGIVVVKNTPLFSTLFLCRRLENEWMP